jgi:YD repeat-containing protein
MVRGCRRPRDRDRPPGRRTWYLDGLLNRVSTVADPLQGLTAFTYDANGSLLTVTDPRGSTLTHGLEGTR